jgi:ATP-dependent Clp protease ATP-binding subunit ClpC
MNHITMLFLPEAIKACVDLTNRYITDRHLPDKAMHLMKQVLEYTFNIVVPTEILEVEQKIIDIKEKKNQVIRGQKYEEAAKLRDVEKQLNATLEIARKDGKEDSDKIDNSLQKKMLLLLFL